ncbi:unnamed protein product [Sphagnum jensenii]|uniref:Uncharacterized protein n=1 Tax=Sphagnum jensenii TaxID=128206 RepID=A0ABP1B3X8_9BRYO
MMDFGSSLPRKTADRYHHSSEAIGKMEKRTSALEIMSVMEEDKGRNVNFRRGRVKKICSWQLVDMLLKTPRLQCAALTAENEVGLSLGFCCVAVIAGWDDEALLLCLESPL